MRLTKWCGGARLEQVVLHGASPHRFTSTLHLLCIFFLCSKAAKTANPSVYCNIMCILISPHAVTKKRYGVQKMLPPHRLTCYMVHLLSPAVTTWSGGGKFFAPYASFQSKIGHRYRRETVHWKWCGDPLRLCIVSCASEMQAKWTPTLAWACLQLCWVRCTLRFFPIEDWTSLS